MVNGTNASSSRLNSLLVEHPDELLRVGFASFLFNGIVNYSQAARELPLFSSLVLLTLSIPAVPLVAFLIFATEKVSSFLVHKSVHSMIALMLTGYSSCVVLLEVFRGKEGVEAGNSRRQEQSARRACLIGS